MKLLLKENFTSKHCKTSIAYIQVIFEQMRTLQIHQKDISSSSSVTSYKILYFIQLERKTTQINNFVHFNSVISINIFSFTEVSDFKLPPSDFFKTSIHPKHFDDKTLFSTKNGDSYLNVHENIARSEQSSHTPGGSHQR